MCTSPTLPPSSVRNAPWGVMRETVPSMTAPTSRSASVCSSDDGRSLLERPNLASVPSAFRPRQWDGRPAGATGSAVGVGGAVGQDQRRLAGPDHAEALPGEPFELDRVVEPLDLCLETRVLLRELLRLLLELGD